MKCFNCGCEIVDTALGKCDNCSVIINETKTNFISYIGPTDSLSGYQKSYKLLLLKYIIEALLDKTEATVARVIPAIKQFYLDRKSKGMSPDYDVDTRILNIENSSDYDVFAVIKSQPFKVINEKGYLFLNHNSDDKLVFVFNEDISEAMSDSEWCKLLSIINSKINLYFSRYDDVNNLSVASEEFSFVQEVTEQEPKEEKDIDLSLSVLDIINLSARAKNILMRNKLYTIGAVINFVQDNDLRSLKNMGQKTFEEIMELLKSSDFRVSSKSAADSIATLFDGNTYHMFVDFCNRNCMTTLSDLEKFDFSLLLSEPGFGISKLNAIKKKYYSLTQELNDTCEVIGDKEIVKEQLPTMIIDPSNIDLEIRYLRFADISTNNNIKFRENGYSKIGDLKNITLGKLIQMFGRSKGIDFFDKIKRFEKPLLMIATDRLNKLKTTREFDIYFDRANKKTLQGIADTYGLTRERVRQIESKIFKEYAPLFATLVEQHMTKNNLSYITTQEVLEFFDDDAFDTVIMYTLKESRFLEYLSFADIFIKKQTETQNTEEKLRIITDDFIGDEGINFFESLSQIEEMLNTANLEYISVDSFLNYLIERDAHFYGDFVFLRKQTYAKLCQLLIAKHFKDGIFLYSDEDINKLRKLFNEEYGGEYILPEKNRAISARLSDCLIMCDRGKANLIENINFEQSVIDDVKKYIDSSPLKTLYFSEIFNEFEGVLAFTSDITNYHGLHGLLAYLYRDEYEFSKDCITKINSKGESLNLSERIALFIKEKGRAVTRNEIKQHIGGLSDIMLFSAINNSNKLLQWDYNSFNAQDNLFIDSDDKTILSGLIEEIFAEFKGYCSDRLIFNKLEYRYPEFISRNNIENATNLFYVLQNILDDKYQFSRPHICKNNIVGSLTTKNIAIYLLGLSQQISRSEFVQLAKNVFWSETTSEAIFYELEQEYIRISDDVYILSTDFNIEENILNQIADWLNNYITTNGYLSMISFDNFENLPSTQYEWNTFLLVSIIQKYDLGFRVVSPAIKDRRYNKEIIVSKDSNYYHLDDIVYSLLEKNGINFIDESNLLAFLVINHLVPKVIPKELFDSPILNYSDGYFKIEN